MSDWKNVQYKDGKLRTNEGSSGSSTFAGLDDVDFSNLQDGQVAKYDAQNEKWINDDESGGASSMADLDDVDLTGISDGDTLVYDATNQEFIPGTPSGGGNVDDVEINGTSVVDQNKVAKIVSYKEVTQSQYNALPASKESDGILYCIKDAPGGIDGFPPLIYSEEEREIGVWTNGKPLYQKTLIYTPSALNQNIDMSALNIDTVVEFSGSFVRAMGSSYGNYDYPIIGRTEGSSYNQYGLSYRYQEIAKVLNIIIGGYTLEEIINVRMTIRYTKTTDTAGSGQWSTQGVYAHHYSTTEHVIGTWIDRKPIYEKVFVLSNSLTISNTDWTSIGVLASSINAESYIRCFALTETGTLWDAMNVATIDSYVALTSWRNGDTIAVKTVVIQYTKTTD